MRGLEDFLARILGDDLGKLILRLTIGILMLVHGYSKLNGIDGIKYLVTNGGFPEFLAYGVYIGEIVAPIFIIIGFYTRISSFICTITMIFAVYLAHSSQIFTINEKTGGLSLELQFLFMFTAIALMFLGAGKISFDKK